LTFLTSGERHKGKAGMVLFAGKTVCSMPERFMCTLVQKRRYINTLPFLFPFVGWAAGRASGQYKLSDEVMAWFMVICLE